MQSSFQMNLEWYPCMTLFVVVACSRQKALPGIAQTESALALCYSNTETSFCVMAPVQGQSHVPLLNK